MADRPSNPATDPTVAPEALAGTLASAGGGGVAPAAGSLRPGTVVAATYEITRLLGQGGMGAVWEAQHLRLPDKRVVVKVLLFGATDPVMLARFRREAEIASRLGHPNIVQVLDFNALPDGAPYIVLELLQGETLAARLFRGRPTFEQTLAIVDQIGSALAAAHREGIVHRDLKPDNIFLCPTGSTDVGADVRDLVKILDFGISKIRGAKTVLTQDAALIGTPQYMAPEQATGRNDEIDARTDIFAFGAIVFEMLAGRPPFLGDTLAAVIHAVVYAPTPSLRALAPETPAGVVAAVERALAKGRDERFADVGGFVKAVTSHSLATSVPIARSGLAQTRSAAAPEPVATERVRRGRAFPRLGAAIALGVVAGAVWFFARPSAGPAVVNPSAPVSTPPANPVESPKIPARVDPPATAVALGATPTAPPPTADRNPPAAKSARPVASGGGSKAETLNPAAAADLADAEAALAAGQSADALRLAQHSLYAQKSARAYALIVRAYCAGGDLGNARGALSHVAAHDRAAVVRSCGKLGVDLH